MKRQCLFIISIFLFCSQLFGGKPPDYEIPSVKVTSPRNRALLKQGTVYIIRWKATDNRGIVSRSIYFSTDGRISWVLIDSVAGNSGTYSWSVPSVASKNGVIKIFAYDAAGNMCSSESNQEFVITPATKMFKKYSSLETERQVFIKEDNTSYFLHMQILENQNVTISDMNGRELISFITNDDNQWFQIPLTLSPGMHIVTVRSSEKTFYSKAYFAM